ARHGHVAAGAREKATHALPDRRVRGDKMNCNEIQNLIHAYVDGELDLVRSLELETHLRECDPCSQELARIRELLSRLKTFYHEPRPGFDRSILTVTRNADRASRNAEQTSIRKSWRAEARPIFTLRALLAVASILAIVAAGAVLFTILSRPRSEDLLAR